MMAAERVTAIVEPNFHGHRLQWVSHLTRALADEGPVVLLTSKGGATSDELRSFLTGLPIEAREVFDDIITPAAEMGRALRDLHRERPLHRFVVTDADQMLKRWWLVAPRELRWPRGPRSILVMGRFPPRINLRDRHLLWLRTTKWILSALAVVTGAAQRVAYVSARDLDEGGWFLKRAIDPAICSAHARDRAKLREQLELPADRRLVAILGLVDERKCVPLVGPATFAAAPDVDLLLAGAASDDVLEWLDALPAEQRQRVHLRNAFHPDDVLDAYTAASDVVAIVHLNPGPSGIMGKAQAAGVPVLSAGSEVRRKETEALGSGVHVDATVEALTEGLRTILARGREPAPLPPSLATPERFAAVILGR